MIKFAVLSFPGNNCENETVRAFKRAGMEAEIVLWNDPGLLDRSRTAEFSGYCLVGGFSYEDRGRSGVVAARQPIMKVVKSEAAAGKVVLGICNGAQMLVETGLVPGFDGNPLAVSLAWNEMKQDGQIVGTGFYNVWVHLKNTAPRGRSAFSDFDSLLHVPVAHGEGRFVMKPEVFDQLEKNGQILFRYCDESGVVDGNFPVTPNGAMGAAAAIGNPAGNVMAIMPHPERDPLGRGHEVFDSIRRWIENRAVAAYKPLGAFARADDVRAPEKNDLEFFVGLIITDNAERTIESALRKIGYNVTLERYMHYGIQLEQGIDPERAIGKIIASGELANLNKETVVVRSAAGTLAVDKNGHVSPHPLELGQWATAREAADTAGASKAAAINAHAGRLVRSIEAGVLWHFVGADAALVTRVIESQVLYNPHSMFIERP